MTADEIRKGYLEFMKSKGHAIVPSSAVVPENDPTTLFTGSGMQPMISYLLGEEHPLGDRIADSQKCVRAEDMDEVGNNRHTTFFEMLGNWSLGSYWKEEQLNWIWEFLIDVVGLDPNKVYVTVFAGDKQAGIPKDDEAVAIWKKLFADNGIEAKEVEVVTEARAAEDGMQGGRIFYYEASKNWWSRAGVPENMPAGEPGGPDSEIFYEFTSITHDPAYGTHCHPNCECGRFMEIGNSVFMAYVKQDDGSFVELPSKNIDFGGGLERIAAAANDNPDVFAISFFRPMIEKLESASGKAYEDHLVSMRIIADHMRGSVHIVGDGVMPGNKMQGYLLRRMIRRSLLELDKLGLETELISELCDVVVEGYKEAYPGLSERRDEIVKAISDEAGKFAKTLKKGLREFEKLMDDKSSLSGEMAFRLFETYGFPLELSIQAAQDREIDLEEKIEKKFESAKSEHASKSRSAAKGMFKGGLADQSERTTQYHTATHLLHQALREVLGNQVQQMGSNITGERLRFDYRNDGKLKPEEIERVIEIINRKIDEGLPVHKTSEEKDRALESGALAFFNETYPDRVSVYTIGVDPDKDWYSKELCGGPHVESTGEIPKVEIFKQKSIGAGVQRVYLRARG